MVPTHFVLTTGILAQTNTQPAVPGAVGNSGGTAIQQVPGGSTGSTSQSSGGNAPNPLGSMWIFLVPILLLILMTSFGGKKQQKQRAAMLSALARNDRVLTTGGIIGTVVELYDQEMVLRVDEAANTRIRFARSAVQQILRESKDGTRAELESKPAAELANSR